MVRNTHTEMTDEANANDQHTHDQHTQDRHGPRSTDSTGGSVRGSRRAVLATAGTAMTGLLAGCTGVGGFINRATNPLDPNPPVDTRYLQFGETLELETVTVTVSDPRLTEVQTWTVDSEQHSIDAPENLEWLFAHVRTTNISDGLTRLPLTLHFSAIYGDTIYKPGRNHDLDGKYIGGDVESGVTREGDAGFLLPDETDTDEVGILYRQQRSNEKHRVVWNADGGRGG